MTAPEAPPPPGPNAVPEPRAIRLRGSEERQQISLRDVSILADIGLRVFVTIVLVGVFVWLNYAVIDLIHDLFVKTGALDANIVIALIGGTVSQVAGLTYLVLRYLFRA